MLVLQEVITKDVIADIMTSYSSSAGGDQSPCVAERGNDQLIFNRGLNVTVCVAGSESDGGGAGVGRRNNLRLQESPPKTLTVDVLSSQTRVAVTVDGATVSVVHLLCCAGV